MSKERSDAAKRPLDRRVMPAVHIYAPPVTRRFILTVAECPDCKQRSRFLGFAYEWHGASLTCLRCGRQWEGGEWMALPFMRGARQHNIDEAKAHWRRLSRHNVK